MPIANTECIKYYKSGMATLFHSYKPIKTLTPAVGFVIRSKHGGPRLLKESMQAEQLGESRGKS